MGLKLAFKLDGLKPALDSLRDLKRTTANKILRAAITEGTKPILDAIKARAPRESGLLRRSLGRRIKTYRKSGAVVAIIGPRKGFKQEVTVKRKNGRKRTLLRDPVHYAHLLEFGHVQVSGGSLAGRGRKGKGNSGQGKVTGSVAPRPFMRAGFNAAKDAAVNIIARRIADEIAKLTR